MVDLHCDETDDPLLRHIETLAAETQRLGLGGRVTGSHLTSMHSMDNYYVRKLIPLMREAGVAAIANPLINITLQGRHDTYPKRRGMTRVPELMAAGITVAFGQDCVMDPWYSLGSADMLEVAHMGVHVGQMTRSTRCAPLLRRGHHEPAAMLELDGYGLGRAAGPTWCCSGRRPVRGRAAQGHPAVGAARRPGDRPHARAGDRAGPAGPPGRSSARSAADDRLGTTDHKVPTSIHLLVTRRRHFLVIQAPFSCHPQA